MATQETSPWAGQGMDARNSAHLICELPGWDQEPGWDIGSREESPHPPVFPHSEQPSLSAKADQNIWVKT